MHSLLYNSATWKSRMSVRAAVHLTCPSPVTKYFDLKYYQWLQCYSKVLSKNIFLEPDVQQSYSPFNLPLPLHNEATVSFQNADFAQKLCLKYVSGDISPPSRPSMHMHRLNLQNNLRIKMKKKKINRKKLRYIFQE